jgi:hypothetical protein
MALFGEGRAWFRALRVHGIGFGRERAIPFVGKKHMMYKSPSSQGSLWSEMESQTKEFGKVVFQIMQVLFISQCLISTPFYV